MLQRVFRGHKTRRAVSALCAERTVRVWDPEAGRDFYYDRHTQASSWTKPLLLRRKEDLDRLEYMHLDSEGSAVRRRRWACKTNCPRRRKKAIRDRPTAAAVLQGFFRCLRARRVVLEAARAAYCRVWDESHEQHYYYNARSGESSWSKPLLFLTAEAPLLLLTSGAESRRSPRVNREPLVVI